MKFEPQQTKAEGSRLQRELISINEVHESELVKERNEIEKIKEKYDR